MTTEEACVGIFWGLPTSGGVSLLVEKTPISKAGRYGDALTHEGGHYEFWEGLRSLAPVELRRRSIPLVVKADEYEAWPRGRVVMDFHSGIFTIYADRQLLTPEMRVRISAAFYLIGAETRFSSDPHYRSSRRLT